MAKIEYTEKLWKSSDGSKRLDRLTVHVNGKEAQTFTVRDLEILYGKDAKSMRTQLRLHLMGVVKTMSLSDAEEEELVESLATKILSYKK